MAPRRHGNICCVAAATEDHNRTQETDGTHTAHTHDLPKRSFTVKRTHTLYWPFKEGWPGKRHQWYKAAYSSGVCHRTHTHSIHLDWTSNIRSPIYITCRNAVVTTALTSPNDSTPSAKVMRSFAKPTWSLTQQTLIIRATVNNPTIICLVFKLD